MGSNLSSIHHVYRFIILLIVVFVIYLSSAVIRDGYKYVATGQPNITQCNSGDNVIHVSLSSAVIRDGYKYVTTGQPHLTQYYSIDNFIHLNHPEYLANYASPCWTVGSHVQCIPSIYLAGAPKAGTTDLFRIISKHPSIHTGMQTTGEIKKEPHFWGKTISRRGEFKRYLELYLNASRIAERVLECPSIIEKKTSCYHPQLLLDGSASTLWSSYSFSLLPGFFQDSGPELVLADLLSQFIPNIKLIVILRDPVDRLFSDYFFLHSLRNKSAEEFHKEVVQSINAFNKCVAERSVRACAYSANIPPGVWSLADSSDEALILPLRLYIGIYHVFLSDWIRNINYSRVHVLRLKDYSRDKAKEVGNIFKFLNISSTEELKIDSRATNSRRNIWKDVKMWPQTRTILQKFYTPFNHQLAELLDDQKYTWSY